MKFPGKTLGLLLVSLGLASCGGGGGDGGGFSAPQSGTITLSATTRQLPVYTGSTRPGPGTPYEAEVDAIWKNADGSLVTVCGTTATAVCKVAVSISPVETAGIGIPDDPSTTINEASIIYVTTPVTASSGHATFWVVASSIAGPATLTVTGVDPQTGRSVSASMQFTIVSGVGTTPASIDLAPAPTGIYIPGSSGTTNSVISALVRDGAGQFVPDPAQGNSGADNLQAEIVGDSGGGVLAATSVTGSSSGNSVQTHTVQGIATVSFQSGTTQGPIQIKFTADRADNNVSNGIQNPVTASTTVVVSDGKLYSLELTSPVVAPNLPGITINTVSGNVSTGAGTTIPADPDATLSLVVTALGTDRQGNPVLANTPIRFGSVDEPVGDPGTPNDNQFLLSGLDGQPQVGGTTFTAPTGQFTTAGGGAGPGDALVVFGKAVEGFDDLESAVTVTRVNSATNLTVSPAFNSNTTTGASVQPGPVLPYLIGRSMHGNITASALTDDKGVAHASLNYTVNTVGDAVAIWAQGDGVDRVTNGPRRVTDAGTLAYPGVAPATITLFPNPIPGDTTTSVTACVTDALGIPLRGVQVGFKFTLTAGSGSLDGTAGTGFFDHLTDQTGCVQGSVVTTGLPVSTADGSSGQLVASGAGATSDPIDIVVQLAALQASPNAVAVNCSGSQTSIIEIRAVGPDGSPLPGVDVEAQCTASGGATLAATPATGTTGDDGTIDFSIAASGFIGTGTPPTIGTGQCKFVATGTARSVTVQFAGNPNPPSPPPTCR